MKKGKNVYLFLKREIGDLNKVVLYFKKTTKPKKTHQILQSFH